VLETIAVKRTRNAKEKSCATRCGFAITGFLLTALIIVAHPLSSVRPDGKLHIDFLDVGQGDSASLTMP
jgi:hypothetical protein